MSAPKQFRTAFALVACLTSSIFATNGANLIGLTPASTSMGGVGIAFNTGVESLVKNPALLAYQDRPTLLIGSNVVLLDTQARVSYQGAALTADTGYVKSDATTFLIPEFAYISPINKDWRYGLGIFGASGFGIDHRNQTNGSGLLANIRSHMMALKFVPGVSYQNGPISVGLSSHITYAQMSFSAWMPDASGAPATNAQRGGGTSEAISTGLQWGISYDINSAWRVGGTYQSPIGTEFKKLFDFDRNGTYDDITFELPAELGIGIAGKFLGFDLSVDTKQIFWSNAKGFNSLNWKDQTVVALGAQYQATQALSLRVGYNYAPSVVSNTSGLSVGNGTSQFGTGTFLDSNIAFFNTVGLGGIVGEQSITMGAAYQFNPDFKLDGAVQFGVGNTVTQSGKTTVGAYDDTNATYSTKVDSVITTIAGIWTF